ncbi:ArsR family transcriptional regulator [Candidatus Woesearchaeota archaeon]|nr:ArsR family transcriptional regulator [Candidatus Woesearchaeota archaeon]
MFRVTLIKSRRPTSANINEQLRYFGHSLGLLGERDKDKSCFRLFIELFKSTKQEPFRTSDELANSLNLTRATVIHHLSKLMDSGLVVQERNKYCLREESLTALVEGLERDLTKTLGELKELAKHIDRTL